MKVGSADENVTGESGAVVRSDHALINGLVPVHSVCHFVISNLLIIILIGGHSSIIF